MVCMYTVCTRCWKYLPGRKINQTYFARFNFGCQQSWGKVVLMAAEMVGELHVTIARIGLLKGTAIVSLCWLHKI